MAGIRHNLQTVTADTSIGTSPSVDPQKTIYHTLEVSLLFSCPAGSESVDGTTILGEDDLQDVRSAVADLAARWKDLGISLGIHLSELNAILSSNSHSPSDCLRETLAIRLKQNYNVERFGKPKWRRLVEAVEDKVGGNNCALAQAIARDHPGAPDKNYRKLEHSYHSRLYPEEGKELTNPVDIFSLPQYIRVMVSNYQPLQTVFSISESEYHTRQIKTDERFSPIVTIVDTATQQPLDCVLLLHGEKPPEVTCRTLFCYIAVQVSNDDVHGSYPHPLYHVESKPCKQGKLPLIFCFHQPGTVCNIQMSIHSMVDSEGVEYMHHSESCDCIVRVIYRDRHGVVRMKEPPRLRYTGPLATKQFHKLERRFTELFRSPGDNKQQILQLSKQMLAKTSSGVDIKVYALCWKALSVGAHKNYELAEKSLRTALKKASKLECENGLLLQGRVLRHLAFVQYIQGNDDKALEYMSGVKSRLFLAVPFNETAHALHTELLIESRRLLKGTFSSELYTSTERDYELLLEHTKYMEEYDKIAVCNFHAVKASFHLRSKLITDKLPPEEYWPSPDDLRKAEECLKRVSLDIMPSQSNLYKARYFCTVCDLYIWKHEYPEAMYYLDEARKLYEQTNLNPTMCKIDQRLQLLESLKENDKQNQ